MEILTISSPQSPLAVEKPESLEINLTKPNNNERPVSSSNSPGSPAIPSNSSFSPHVQPAPSQSPWLVVSPYTESFHQLNLSTLDLPNQLLALALTNLTSATQSYATTSYASALDWPVVFAALKTLSDQHSHTWTRSTFYVVEFRSKLKANINRELLFELDKESHREATASGGLLKYWFGEPDEERRNLATCLWRSKEDAIAGGKGPQHRKARAVIPQMYESINVKGLKLTIEDDVRRWKFEDWRD